MLQNVVWHGDLLRHRALISARASKFQVLSTMGSRCGTEGEKNHAYSTEEGVKQVAWGEKKRRTRERMRKDGMKFLTSALGIVCCATWSLGASIGNLATALLSCKAIV
jgi:hypothetical protein